MRKVALWTGLFLGVVVVCTAQVTFTVFPGPVVPSVSFITAGPDGNLWFTQEGPPCTDCNYICKMTTAGVITQFSLPYSGGALGSGSEGPIVLGPDGNLWFTHYRANRIGKINPNTGSIEEFWIPSGNAFPSDITVGPDGNLWFTEVVGTCIGKIDPSNGTITEFPLPWRATQYGAARITAGSDGNLWYTEPDENTIGRITPQGDVTEFLVTTLNSFPFDITSGPDGNLWFTEEVAGKIGRITLQGVITEFDLPAGADPQHITVGLDGNLWFTEVSGKFGRITPTGSATEFQTPTPGGRPYDITVGPDGNLWFTELLANNIVRVNLYKFVGFDSPIDNVPTVNVAKAGSTIPVKWRFTDFEGSPISDPLSFTSLTSYTVPDEYFSGEPADEVETISSSGASGLQYLGDGYWQFNWKTTKGYVGQCRIMVLKLADGSEHTAYFRFK